MVTATAEACQALCAQDKQCGEFEWWGSSGKCVFHCPGTNNPGSTQCVIGQVKANAGMVCGPAHNDSSAPAPPPAPPAPPPSPECPVPFGLSGGVLEAGTDHARADGLKGTITELICKPWCLFNRTSDIGERTDLGGNPAFQELAQKMADRLKYHGTTGPMPAYIWPLDGALWKEKQNDACLQSVKSGYIEPVDLELFADEFVTLLD
jgi:hypothetical protein